MLDFQKEYLDLIKSFNELTEAQQQLLNSGPPEFTFGNQTYVHIPGTESFTIPESPKDDEGNPTIVFTPLQIMKQHFKDTRSLYRRITPQGSAIPMLWLGNSARYKILRAVQLHHIAPPITDETNSYTPFFQFLSTGVEDHWQIQQQYASCKWAAPKDEALATSMLLHYGFAQTYREIKMKGNCIYQMRRAPDGIHLIISTPHSFNDRLTGSCARAAEVSAMFEGANRHAPYELLFKEACRVFFSYNGYYISITAEYRQTALNKIQAFCTHLCNAFEKGTQPPIPYLEEPDIDTCIQIDYDEYGQPMEYIMKWDDFIIEEKSSSAQWQQRENNNMDACLKGLIRAWQHFDPDGEYSYAELTKHCTTSQIAAAKKRDYLIAGHSEGRKTFWKLNYDIIERSLLCHTTAVI